MPIKERQQGKYELFETTSGSWILVLDNDRWAAWVEGQAGDILVATDEDHEKNKTLEEGEYLYLDFEDDPKFKDMPHLFLDQDGSLHELILPNGWPDPQDRQKKVIESDKGLTRRELDEHLASGPPAGPGEERMRRPGGGSMSNVTHQLRGFDFPGNSDDLIEHARDRGAPDEVIGQLEKLPQRRYANMADVTGEIGERTEFPIDDYDSLSVQEAAERVKELSGRDLETVEDYERETLNRDTVLKAIDAKKDSKVPDDYDQMRADQAQKLVWEVSGDELEALEGYEREHLGRKSVLEAIDERKGQRR